MVLSVQFIKLIHIHKYPIPTSEACKGIHTQKHPLILYFLEQEITNGIKFSLMFESEAIIICIMIIIIKWKNYSCSLMSKWTEIRRVVFYYILIKKLKQWESLCCNEKRTLNCIRSAIAESTIPPLHTCVNKVNRCDLRLYSLDFNSGSPSISFILVE